MSRTFILILIPFILLAACTAAPTATPAPTNTPLATATPQPTNTPLPTSTATATPTLTETPKPTATATATSTPTPTKDPLAIPQYQLAPFPPPVETWYDRLNPDNGMFAYVWVDFATLPKGGTMQNLAKAFRVADPLGYATTGFFKGFTDRNHFNGFLKDGYGKGATMQRLSVYGFEVLCGLSLPKTDSAGNRYIEMYAKTRNAKGESVIVHLVNNIDKGVVSVVLNIPTGGSYGDPCCIDLIRKGYNIFQEGDGILIFNNGRDTIYDNAKPNEITEYRFDVAAIVAYVFQPSW